MTANGAPCIDNRQRNTDTEAYNRHAAQQVPVGRKVGVYLLTPDVIAYQKQAKDLKVAVAVDKLLHSHQRSLNKKLKHLSITVGIAQPIAEVFFCYAVLAAVMPLSLNGRSRETDAEDLCQCVDSHGQQRKKAAHESIFRLLTFLNNGSTMPIRA